MIKGDAAEEIWMLCGCPEINRDGIRKIVREEKIKVLEDAAKKASEGDYGEILYLSDLQDMIQALKSQK